MPRVKKWSTGSIGNPYPDHSERNNPNTRGLSIDGVPGVEGFIEEDRVLASEDNRPIENLTQNDQVLEKNLTSIASEVDYGVLKGKDNEFKIEVLQKGDYPNPDNEEEIIEISPLRIHSGQAIVDGQVTSIGSQKIIYFLKDDGSYIFPDYQEHKGKTVIPIFDDLYTGSYKPVYDTETNGLPESFENYEIKIINKYDIGDDRITYFKVYRDWEDIIPYTPYTEDAITNLNFIYDENYGRKSEGVWLKGGDVDNIKISEVVVTKDIEVKDKKLSNFNQNGSAYEQYIITDGIFFDNIPWKTETQEKREVQDLYVDNEGAIFFVYKHQELNENLFYLPVGSTQTSNVNLFNTQEQAITKITEINGILYILGTNGYFATYDVVNRPDNLINDYTTFIDSTENFNSIVCFGEDVWVATDKNIYKFAYTNLNKDMTVEAISFADEIDTKAGNTGIVNKINVLKTIRGNFFVDSSLKTNIHNLVKNASFEQGGIGEVPNYWTTTGQFEINAGNAKYGNYKAILSANTETFQNIITTNGKEYTYSVYLKSVVDTDVELFIGEETQVVSLVGGADWERFYMTFIASDTAFNFGIRNNTANTVQVDAVQVEEGGMNQFVEGFEYLFVGFEKSNNDLHNPPFAFFDSKRLNQVNYAVGLYGEIKTVNDASEKGYNELIFVDDINIYSLIVLNDEDVYDRISINNLTANNAEFNLKTRIDKLKTIEVLNDRIFFGGSILNKSVSFSLFDSSDDHVIEMIDINDPSIKDQLDDAIPEYYNISELLGDYRVVPAHNGVGIKVEFSRTEELYESRTYYGQPGYYKSGSTYSLAFRIDGGDAHIINIQMPGLFEGPISIEYIYNLLLTKYYESTLVDIVGFDLNYSNTKIDGLYSIGKSRITRHIRGNIQRIFVQQNVESQDHYDKGIYIILNNTILRSKYDPNIKKINGVYINKPEIVGTVDNITLLPTTPSHGDVYHVQDFGYYKWNDFEWVDTGYFYHWDLYETDHALREFKNKYNQEITFNDESLNKNWIDLPVDAGYKLVPGSLRVKTNTETEIGFSENKDYFVDYNNNKIIRSTLHNYAQDSNFEFVETAETKWEQYLAEPSGKTFYLKKRLDTYTSMDGEENILDSYASVYVDASGTTDAAIYQYVKPDSLNIGDTYTFSVKLKTNQVRTGAIAISECVDNTSAFTIVNDFSTTNYAINEEDGKDTFNEWHTYIVSHTVTDATSQYLRIEIGFYVDAVTSEQLFIKEAQLERNQIKTPYVKEFATSRIDAGLTVYVDFTQTKDLVSGVDYIFDTAERKIVYYGDINDVELYFDYKYKKIFNPYLFETSIPKFDVSYNDRDDYFLYLYSGRIWAINFVLALLSQDEENPLIVNYKYHYPRIDKIKIRNNPDQYGNYAYVVKGVPDAINPYGPYDKGTDKLVHTVEVSRDKIEDTKSNDMIYEINVYDYNYANNDIYDRRIFVTAADNKYFNISLYDQTVGYFPYSKDFMSTAGMNPINRLYASKIVDIIKNFNITQIEEIGAWGPNYQIALRNKIEYPSTSLSIFVDINYGDDAASGELFMPIKTINEALRRIKEEGASPYIIVKSKNLITEDIEVNIDISEVRIFAQTYAKWKGNIQNKTPLVIQGFQFERHNIYAIESIKFYYCTFINSTINNYFPLEILFLNCSIEGGNNKFLFIKNTIFPSPFLHPYMKNESASDNIDGNPLSVATTDSESIYPNVSSYQEKITSNPSGSYTFYRCLINGLNDDLVNYDLKESEPWISEFIFERCTIVNNANLFVTNKSSQLIQYNECILYNNGEKRGTQIKYFDTQSNINFTNSFIDFDVDVDSSEVNFNPSGLIFGRETCVAGTKVKPGFISLQNNYENYKLRSEAQGFLSDSVCIGRATDGRDLGCYDELRERLDIEVPKKLKSNFAFIGEGIHYPIILNSEKITFILEFKPSNVFSSPAVLFDTRSHIDDKDYIVVVYNNNSGDDIAEIEQNEDNAITDPFTFKIIVANKKSKYVVVSPIQMYSDADYQVWNKLAFVVNYEKTFNEKSAFDEKDKYQNIITMFHNGELAIESFLKNDMSYDSHNKLLEGYNNDNTNAWNYNNISRFITIGSTFDQQYILNGYYSELRIDNKFINRKELEAWNNKEVPFNDPITYLDQDNLARTFDASIVNDLWTLKTKYDVGAKGHRFNKNTRKRFTFDGGEFTWALTRTTTNYIKGGDLLTPMFAQVITDVPPGNDTEDLFPVVFDHRMTIKAVGGNSFDTSTGIVMDFTDAGMQFYSHEEINAFIQTQIEAVGDATKIRIEMLPDNRFKIYTQDYLASSIEVWFENGGDAEEFGFSTASGQGDGYYATVNGSSLTISGVQNKTGLEITTGISQDMANEHNVWITSDKEYTRLSSVSLGVSRIITMNNNDDRTNDDNIDKYITIITHRKSTNQTLGLYDETAEVPYEYTYSLYLYKRDSEFTFDEIKVVVDGVEFKFDRIDNIYGYWWLAQKTLQITENTQPEIGIIVKSETEFYIDAIQLEEGTFASPFVVESTDGEGVIELDKALFNDDRGVLFFRFKPLFRYTTPYKHVLFEALGSKVDDDEDSATFGQDIVNEAKGFKIWYEYDEKINRGKIQFRTVIIEPDGGIPDEASWETIVLEQFWDNWHTVVISYNFDTRRFIYFFDYFKNIVDISITPYSFFTNASIGRDAVIGTNDIGEPIYPFNSHSAEILVKDIVITNYTTSDNELKNWINTNEFYKETLFNSFLNSYQDEMYEAIASIEGLSYNTHNIEQNIITINNKLSTFEGLVDSDIDLTLLKVRQDELRNTVYHETNGILKTLDIFDSVRIDHNDRISTNRNDIITHTALIQENTNNINLEVSNRIDAIDNLIARLASYNLGDGASMVGVHDPNNKFGATNVEAVLFEIEDRVATNETNISSAQTEVADTQTTMTLMQQGDGSIETWSASKAVNNGFNIASLRVDVDQHTINIQTVATDLAQEIIDRTNADDALNTALRGYIDTQITDLSGTGRTTETVKDNYDLIQANTANIVTITTNLAASDAEINKVKDGTDGSSWLESMNLVSHNTRLTGLESAVADNTTNINTNTSNIIGLDTRVDTLESGLTQETADRVSADNAIVNNLASVNGASLIGIEDAADSFTATNIESALQEIDSKLQALAGSLNWQTSVLTPADLPTSGNNLNDARIVEDDGDGKRAQYVWNGTDWVKVSDVDWGDAVGIVYNNADSGLLATDVKAALDELYERSVSSNSNEESISAVDWVSDTDGFYYDVEHGLETENIAVRVVDANGQEIGVDEFERVNANTVRVHVTDAIDATFTVFGAHNSYSKVIGSWTLSGGMYVKDVVHAFNTQQIMISVFNITTGERVGVDSIETLDNNAIRIMTDTNTDVLNVFVLKQTSNTTTKDIDYWVANNGMYETALPLALDYDAVYSFYDPATSKTVEVDEVKFENGLFKIIRTENTPLRMVVLK